MNSLFPMLQESNISLTSHHIFANLNVKKNAIGRDRVPSLHVKEVCFETGFSLSVFSKTTKVEFAELGPYSMVQNVLSMKVLADTILEHFLQTIFTKTIHILRTGKQESSQRVERI